LAAAISRRWLLGVVRVEALASLMVVEVLARSADGLRLFVEALPEVLTPTTESLPCR